MRSFHNFVSTKPPAADNSLVRSTNWNDIHPVGAVPTAYAATGVVPASVDLIRATGGALGIQLTLSQSATIVNTPNGPITVYQTYYAMRVDAAAGAVEFLDPSGALFNGDPSYSLTDQWQWAIFAWNGVSWDVFGN